MQFDFLICSERSGRNLITRILDAHPGVCAPFPRHAFSTFALNYYKYGDISRNQNWEILVHDMAAYMNSGFSVWKTRVTPEMIFQNVKTRSLSEILRYIYELEAVAHHKKRIFVKENHAYAFLPFILNHFPEARFIHVVRDPRDMALTWKESAFYGGVKTAVPVWLKDQQRSMQAYGFLKDLGLIIIVKFEEILSNTKYEAGRICDFLNIAYDDAMLNFYENDTVSDNLSRDPLGGWADLKKPIIKDNFNRYRSHLSDAEIKYVESICKDEMEYFGYKRDFPNDSDLRVLENQLPDEDTIVDQTRSKMRRNYRVEFYRQIEIVKSQKLYLIDMRPA